MSDQTPPQPQPIDQPDEAGRPDEAGTPGAPAGPSPPSDGTQPTALAAPAPSPLATAPLDPAAPPAPPAVGPSPVAPAPPRSVPAGRSWLPLTAVGVAGLVLGLVVGAVGFGLISALGHHGPHGRGDDRGQHWQDDRGGPRERAPWGR